MQSKPFLTADLDGKNTFVSGLGIPMKGLEFGICYQNKISYMLAWYFLGKPVYGTSVLNKGTLQEVKVNTALYIGYASFIAEYQLYRNKRWRILMPCQIGFGQARKEYYDAFTRRQVKRNNMLPVELSITGNYRIWKFVGLSGGLGYRRAFSGKFMKDEDFNGITYSFGVKIWFGDLCYWMMPKCRYCKYL